MAYMKSVSRAFFGAFGELFCLLIGHNREKLFFYNNFKVLKIMEKPCMIAF